MRKKNILFISIGSLAFGESVMALNFARSLSSAGYQPNFIVSELNSVLLKDYADLETLTLYPGGHKVNRLLIDDWLDDRPPDLVVLCDFLTFEYARAHFGLTLDDLRAFGAPIISLDSYEWESADFVLDFFGGTERRVEPLLLELDGALRPCPLNKPWGGDRRTACYSFLDQLPNTSASASDQVRSDLGIGATDTIVFSATAAWEKLRAKEYVCPFMDKVPKLIEWYISHLEGNVHWIRVGGTGQLNKVVKRRVTQHSYPSLNPTEFDRLLRASDVLVTTNIASTTLAKRIRDGGAAVFLYNSVTANGPGDLGKYRHIAFSDGIRQTLADAYPVRPFSMFPIGFHRFLKPVLTDNPYLDTFYRAELLDESAVVSALRQAASTASPLRTQIEDYKAQLAALPSAGDCIDQFLSQKANDRMATPTVV